MGEPARRGCRVVAAAVALALGFALLASGSATAATQLRGVGNVPGCLTQGADPTYWLRHYHASVLRVVVNAAYGSQGQAVRCVKTAHDRGYKVELAIQWRNAWRARPAFVGRWFRHVLQFYAPYVWAVEVGNEQELKLDARPTTPAQYIAIYKTVEPVLKRLTPRAIRVVGDIAPFGIWWLTDVMKARIGQAIAAHPYNWWDFRFPTQQALALGATYRMPVFFDEGLRAAGSYPSTRHDGLPFPGDRRLQALKGAALVAVWLA